MEHETHEIAERILELLAASPTGIVTMQDIAKRLQVTWDGTIQTNRTRIRRALKAESRLVELVTRTGRWDITLPNSMLAWITDAYDEPTGQSTWRVIFNGEQASRRYGSGRLTWITTRDTVDQIVAARQQQMAAQRAEESAKREAETRTRWAEARRRDPQYAALLQQLGERVPGLEIRVLPVQRSDDVFVAFEVVPESAEVFKTLLRQLLQPVPVK